MNALADPHHLADTDPVWAGGDAFRIRRLATMVTPSAARPVLGLVDALPGPVAAALRTGLDTLIGLVPRGRTAMTGSSRRSARSSALPRSCAKNRRR